MHFVCDGRGTPLTIEVTPGQNHESKHFEETVNAVRIPQKVGRPKTRPKKISGDKGYSYPRIRQWLQAHKIKGVIPSRSNQKRQKNFDRESYRKRNIVERCIGWLKECRRVATRFEKLAVNFLAMLKLAMVQRCFRYLSDRA